MEGGAAGKKEKVVEVSYSQLEETNANLVCTIEELLRIMYCVRLWHSSS